MLINNNNKLSNLDDCTILIGVFLYGDILTDVLLNGDFIADNFLCGERYKVALLDELGDIGGCSVFFFSSSLI